MPQIDLFLIAAEPSADLQGAKLIEALLTLAPHLRIAAVAGPRMRKLPIQTLFPMENLQVMGFIDVLKALPKIGKQFFAIRNTILSLNPKSVVTIDYPGFNLRLAKSLRKKKFPGKLIHYICPTVWAWGKKRIPLMEQNLDLLLTLFPFEKNCFSKSKMQIEHVGHPLTGAIPPNFQKREKILAIFPGSRHHEIERNLPLQLAVAKRIKAQDPSLQIAISISSLDKEEQIRNLVQDFPSLLIPPDKHYALMQTAQLAIATSGTVTLELALHNTPTVVNYAIRPLDLFLAQKVFRIHLPFYCLVNIIASKEVFPEFFGPRLTEEALYSAAIKLWTDAEKQQECKQECEEIRRLLGDKNASEQAANRIMKTLR